MLAVSRGHLDLDSLAEKDRETELHRLPTGGRQDRIAEGGTHVISRESRVRSR